MNIHRPDGRDPFAPGTIDEAIDAYLNTPGNMPVAAGMLTADTPADAPATADMALTSAQLARDLADAYTLPAEAEGSLARARIRVRLTPAGSSHLHATQTPARAGDRLRTVELDDTPTPAPGASGNRRLSALRTTGRMSGMRIAWQTVAAALLVALLGGAFFAVTHLQRSAAGASGVWENASITAAKARGAPLNFDPTQGADYAVSVTGSTIFVNGYASGANHLWYSANGGQTYAPFKPDLPPTQLGQTYILATVAGWSGVFASAGMPDGPLQPVYYAEPGASHWTEVKLPTTAQTRGVANTSATVHASDVWKAIFSVYTPSEANPAQGADGWLFAQALLDPNVVAILGTPDLGQTWYVLSASLNGVCSQFATDGISAQHLVCLVGTHAWQTQDGGLTWTQMMSIQGTTPQVYTQIWMSADAAYSYGQGGVEQSGVYRYSFAAKTWQNIGVVPTLPQGGGADILGVTSDDTPYTFATLQGASTITQVYVRHGQAANFAAIGKPVTVKDMLGLPFVFLSDGGKGNVAVYIHDNQRLSTVPLYRLRVG